MKQYPKKRFFQEPTKAQILRASSSFLHIETDLISRIESSLPGQTLIIERPLIPLTFPNSRKFLKHGEEVKPKRAYTLEEVARTRFVPVRLREEAFNNIGPRAYCGYSFMPLTGKDQRKRKVSLVECLEAARICAYAHHLGTGIEIKPYQDSARVETEGAEITVRVPSRTKKRQKYEFNLTSVPVIDGPYKFVVAQSLASSGHDCKRKQFDFRYRYEDDKESSRVFNFCAHEIAAYFKTINYYYYILKNFVPFDMNQFAAPTIRAVDFYKRLLDSVLIKDENLRTKDKLRKLHKAEKEILVWGLVEVYNHDSTFFATEKIENYDWSLRNIA